MNSVHQATSFSQLLNHHQQIDLTGLKRPIKDEKGVTKLRAQYLSKLGVETVWDALRLFPIQYEDWEHKQQITQFVPGQDVAFIATVAGMPTLQYKGRLPMVRTILTDSSGSIHAIWFNQPYVTKYIKMGQTYMFRGKVQQKGAYLSVVNPSYKRYEPDMSGRQSIETLIAPQDRAETIDDLCGDQPAETTQTETSYGYQPVYPLTGKLTQGVMRSIMHTVVKKYVGLLSECLPLSIRQRWQLCELNFAYENMHHPHNLEDLEAAKRRLIFEELFMVQWGLKQIKRSEQQLYVAPRISLTTKQQQIWQKIRSSLPFELTGAQARAVENILSDMGSTHPMNRLIQGDVGSGKTVIAALALAAVCLAGYQGALMAPTGVLATQHYQTLNQQIGKWFKVALLTGQTRAKDRRLILEQLQNGDIDILIGTHALIEDQVVFHQLALTITDEQHRFGVRQRIKIAKEGSMRPHVCVMSATPIPRSLGLILYGDLDMTIVDERPPGRMPIQTYTARPIDRPRVYQLMDKTIEAGQQCYVICPAIQDADNGLSLRSAEETYERLKQHDLPHRRIGLVHGQLKEADKQATMQSFLNGDLDVLVATTVVEVGVDNPNATLMVIENAERFGLSQLHQLRGRIGRGMQQSVCVLLHEAATEQAKLRLKTLCHTDDGFQLAEADLELRGPGDFFGTRQHGLPTFKLANLYEHRTYLIEAKQAVDWLGEQTLSAEEQQQLNMGMEMILGIRPDQPSL